MNLFRECYHCGELLVPGDEKKGRVYRTEEELSLGVRVEDEVDLCAECAERDGA